MSITAVPPGKKHRKKNKKAQKALKPQRFRGFRHSVGWLYTIRTPGRVFWPSKKI